MSSNQVVLEDDDSVFAHTYTCPETNYMTLLIRAIAQPLQPQTHIHIYTDGHHFHCHAHMQTSNHFVFFFQLYWVHKIHPNTLHPLHSISQLHFSQKFFGYTLPSTWIKIMFVRFREYVVCVSACVRVCVCALCTVRWCAHKKNASFRCDVSDESVLVIFVFQNYLEKAYSFTNYTYQMWVLELNGVHRMLCHAKKKYKAWMCIIAFLLFYLHSFCLSQSFSLSPLSL